MTELEIMQRAKTYIDRLANGKNPFTDEDVSEGDIINNVKISRCLFYVSDILRQVIENGGVGAKAKPKKEPFSITDEQLGKFEYSDTGIPISEIAKRINALTSSENMVQFKYSTLTDWLIKKGFLQTLEASDGKKIKRPSDKGNETGIFTEKRNGKYGPYTIVLYSKEAQRFLVDNLSAILSEEQSEKAEPENNQGQPWTREEEDLLIEMYLKNTPTAEIAHSLKRSESGIKKRLKKLELLD